jgi:imidazolonepropionase-like amidohydrolase
MRTLTRFTFVASLVLLASLSTGVHGQSPAAVPPLVIEGATVIDGTGAAPFVSRAVVVENGRIQRVVKAGEMATYPPAAKVINAAGKYLLPGLIDPHVHLRGWDLELYPAFGVTTVVDAGSPTDWILLQRQGVAEGYMRGPRIFASGNVLGGKPEEEGAFQKPHHTWITSVEEARDAIRGHIKAGVDLVKFYPALTPEMLKVIIGEAHAAGLAAGGHVNTLTEALDVGYDFIFHTGSVAPDISTSTDKSADELTLFAEMDNAKADAVVAQMVKKGVYFDSLLRSGLNFAHKEKFQQQDVDLLLNTPDLRYIPLNYRLGIIKEYNQVGLYWFDDLSAERKATVKKAYSNALEFTRRYAKAGGKMITGSDTISSGGLSLHQSLEILVREVGIPPMDALMTVLKNPVELYKLKGVGSVQAGNYGDLIVLEKNPLDDIRNTRSIETVIQNGEVRTKFFNPDFTNLVPRPDPERTSHLFTSPIVNSVAPRMARDGDGDTTITISGTGFLPYSTAHFKGVPLATTFKSRFSLTAVVPARLLRELGTFPVHVENPEGPVGTITGAGQQAYAVLGERDEKSNSVNFMVGFKASKSSPKATSGQ